MISSPYRPMIPTLGDDGVVRLRGVERQPPMGEPPRPTGATLLPGRSPLEQDIAWMFPQLAAGEITPPALRRHARRASDWAVGIAVHRAILTHVHTDGRDPGPAITVVQQELRPQLERFEPSDAETVDHVAALSRHIDPLGPSTDALFDAVRWSRRAEFELAEAYGDGYRRDAGDIVRYRSLESLIADDRAVFEPRFRLLLGVYLPVAYDIAALWRGAPRRESDAEPWSSHAGR